MKPVIMVAGGVHVLGSWAADLAGATGDRCSINVTTTSEGLASANGGT